MRGGGIQTPFQTKRTVREAHGSTRINHDGGVYCSSHATMAAFTVSAAPQGRLPRPGVQGQAGTGGDGCCCDSTEAQLTQRQGKQRTRYGPADCNVAAEVPLTHRGAPPCYQQPPPRNSAAAEENATASAPSLARIAALSAASAASKLNLSWRKRLS